MKKKIFISKDSQSGFRSYLKFLLWAAVGLIVLVLFIPLSSRQKSGKEPTKRPASERGVVVKEIPRPLQSTPESGPRGPGGPGEAPKEGEPKSAGTPDMKSPTEQTGTSQPPTAKEKPLEPPPVTQKAQGAPEGFQKSVPGRTAPDSPPAEQIAKDVQTPPKPMDTVPKDAQVGAPKKPEDAAPSGSVTKPKEVASVAGPASKAKPLPADAKPAASPPAAAPDREKPATPGGTGKMYAVQLGTFKDKQSAEELKQTIQKKGFTVVMKTTNDPKQGPIYALQLQPVESIGKASTLMEQVKYVPKVKPSIVPVSKE